MTNDGRLEDWVEQLSALRQYQHSGKRVPHKPLLVLMALGRLESSLEAALSRPGQIEQAARLLVDAQFPRTVARCRGCRLCHRS